MTRRTKAELEAQVAALEERVAELEGLIGPLSIMDAADVLAALSAHAQTAEELVALARAMRTLTH